MTQRMVLWIMVFVGCDVLSGCAPSAKSEPSVLVSNLHRDTEKARHDNAQAVQLIEEQKWEEVEGLLQSAIRADVTFGPAHNNLGLLYYRQGKLYQAAWEFQYAVKAMPYQPEPKNNLGLVLEAAGRLDEAVKHFDQALAIEPDNPQFIGNTARARFRRGDNDEKLKELLAKLIVRDERPQWIQWARQRLLLLRPSTSGPAGL